MASDKPVRRFIVGIGVGEYDLPELRLPRVAEDVARITGWFHGHPHIKHERALPELGNNPTWQDMQQCLRDWLEQRGPDDVVVIYVAAHGEYEGGKGYIFGRNTPRRRLAGAAFEAQAFGAMLGQFEAHNILVIVDACVAGKLASQIQRAAEDASDEENTRDSHRSWAQALVCSTFGRDPALDGKFAEAFVNVVSDEKWTGTTNQWIDIDQLMRGLNKELASIAGPQVAERKVWGPSPAELIPNPNFATRALGSLIADQELAAHFDPAARGVLRSETGSFFTGREEELRRIVTWLGTDTGTNLVITGSPGSGKSALLSRAVLLSDPTLRDRAGDLSGLLAGTIPPPNVFNGVIWCHNKTMRDVVLAIGIRAGHDVDTPEALIEAVQGQRLTLAIDALDEAIAGDAAAIASRVIAPLAALPGIRFLTATRRQPVRGAPGQLDLLGHLRADPAQTINLDFANNQRRDMRNYVQAHLGAGPSPASVRYRNDSGLSSRLAEQVVAAAGTSFLVAAITARTLAAADTITDPATDAVVLPREAGEAMSAYIDRLADPLWAREVMRPLAWARGAGLPWALWPSFAEALATEVRGVADQPPNADDDVRRVLDAAGDLIVETVENGVPVYRLFHEALAEHLRLDITVTRANTVIADAMMELIHGRPWIDAHPYILAHLPACLAAANDRADQLVSLVSDPVWERAKRMRIKDSGAWLNDVDIALRYLERLSPTDPRQVGLCVVYSHKMATASVSVLEVLARSGQLQRAELMANNLDLATDRVRAFTMLATGYGQVADLESARRCLNQAEAAADAIHDTHRPMAWCWIAESYVRNNLAGPAKASAKRSLEAALNVKTAREAAGDSWDVPNALFWASLALRCVGESTQLALINASAAGDSLDFRNQNLQCASIQGDTTFLRAMFERVRTAHTADSLSSIRPGNLALALADAGMAAELGELLMILPPGTPAEADSQKRYVWALAIAGRFDDALRAFDGVTDLAERTKAAVRIAEVAERVMRQGGEARAAARATLDRLTELFLNKTAPRDTGLDALTAKVLSIAGRHDAALAIAEALIGQPARAADADPTSSRVRLGTQAQGKYARRPLPPDTARIDDDQIARQSEASAREGQLDGARQLALTIRVPASKARALNALVSISPDAPSAPRIWFEALREARNSGKNAIVDVLKNGPKVVNEQTIGLPWSTVAEELTQLECRWELATFAEQYENLRSAFGSGPQRTMRMTNLMAVPRRLAKEHPWHLEDVRAAGNSGEPGKRMFALGLIEGDPKLIDVDVLINCINTSNSAFEQYQSLSLASKELRHLGCDQRRSIREAIEKELAPDNPRRDLIVHSTDRRALAENLLIRLRDH